MAAAAEDAEVAEGRESYMMIDGSAYQWSDLTFAEEEEYRRVLREELRPPRACPPCQGTGVLMHPATEDAAASADVCPRCGGDGELFEPRETDYLLAFVVTVKRRANAGFSVDEAKQMKRSDLDPPRPAPAAKPRARKGT